MIKSSKNSKWASQRIGIAVAILILAVVYVVAQPTLEKWLGVKLPSLIEQNQADNGDSEPVPPSKNGKDFSESSDSQSGFRLKEIGRNTFQSPEGLVYVMGPSREHRIDHILLHAQDDSSRDVHGVFDPGDRDTVLSLLDRGYAMVKQDAREVQSSDDGDRTELTIDMPDPIGYVGGKSGKRDNFPTTNRLKMILENDRIVTAYPTWPRR